MMYDKLIKNLRETDFSDGCPCGSENLCKDNDCLIWQAADAIEKLNRVVAAWQRLFLMLNERLVKEKKKNEWIPVTERLPEEEEVVLVWGGASVYTAKRHNKNGELMWWKLNSRWHYCNPIHWMPLPEAPESEGE